MKVKLLNWIYKALSFVKDFSELVKWIIAILAILGTFGFGIKQCSDKIDIESNLTDRIEFSEGEIKRYKNDLGEKETEVSQLNISVKELKKAHKNAEYRNDKLTRQLLEVRKDLQASNLREKDLKNYIKTDLEASGTEPAPLIFINDTCDFEIKPIKTKHIDLDFVKKNHSLDVSYKYTASVTTMLVMFPERKANGKKHFPNWGWMWGWDHSCITKIDDQNATIINSVELEFTK